MPILHYQLESTGLPDGVLVSSWYQSAQNATVANAIGAASNTNIIAATATVLESGLTIVFGSASPFDAARLQFASVNGGRLWLVIPGANPAIYLPDGETVDPSNALVQAVATAYIASGATAGGAQVGSYVGGMKVRLPVPPIGHR